MKRSTGARNAIYDRRAKCAWSAINTYANGAVSGRGGEKAVAGLGERSRASRGTVGQEDLNVACSVCRRLLGPYETAALIPT